MKQLSKFEIAEIFAFLRMNGVKHYDLQLEMVDHFATQIEEKWAEYPNNWDFQHKILDVYNQIGPEGFKKILEEKSGAIFRRGVHFGLSLLQRMLQIPQIMLSILLISTAYLALQNPSLQRSVFTFSILLPPLVVLLVTIWTIFYSRKKNGRRLISLEANFGLFLLPNGLTFFIHYINETGSFPQEGWQLSIMAILVFIQIIFCLGLCLFVIKSYKESQNIITLYSR